MRKSLRKVDRTLIYELPQTLALLLEYIQQIQEDDINPLFTSVEGRNKMLGISAIMRGTKNTLENEVFPHINGFVEKLDKIA